VARLSIFLVEDEVLIRMMVKDMIESLGHLVTSEAGYLPEALNLANTATFDLAILDVDLGPDNSVPVAKTIAARGLPFIVATAHEDKTVNELFGFCAIVRKPFMLWQLRATIDRITAGC
jgi:CheY-like chemotaxis protein